MVTMATSDAERMPSEAWNGGMERARLYRSSSSRMALSMMVTVKLSEV